VRDDAARMSAPSVGERIAAVRRRIERAGGRDVTLVAVTKGFGPMAVEAALGAGVVDVGENYAQELARKAMALEGLGDRVPRWHFIGRLQRNKVRMVAHLVHLWQSVDRLSLGHEIAHRAPGAAVLVQVNTSREVQKGGCPLGLAPGLIEGLADLGLDVRGVMTMASAGPPETARAGFRAVVALADRYRLPVRSMGMSADLEVAVGEGATMVRVGTDLFGPRETAGEARH
jgi:PLP dependent protein